MKTMLLVAAAIMIFWSSLLHGQEAPRAATATRTDDLKSRMTQLARSAELAAEQAASYQQLVEMADLDLAVHNADRARIEALESEARRLRVEMGEQPAAPSPEADPAGQSPADPELSMISRWLSRDWSGRSVKSTAQRTRSQVDEELRRQGITIKVDGEPFTQRFTSLAHLEAVINEQKRILDSQEQRIRTDRQTAQIDLQRAYQSEADLRREMRDAQAEWQRLTDREESTQQLDGDEREAIEPSRPESSTGAVTPDYIELFEAIYDEITSPVLPTGPATPPDAAEETSQAPASVGSQLREELAGDLLEREEYQQILDQRRQAAEGSSIIDEQTRRQATTIQQQLAATNAAVQRAEREYEQLIRRNAAAEELRRAQAEWSRAQAQWQRQLQQMQQLTQAIQQASGGRRGSPATGAAPPTYCPKCGKAHTGRH